jgi:transcription termination factor NusB
MPGMEEKMLSTPFFDNLFFMEAPYSISMTKDRYLNVWKSVNDIQVQAGPQRFAEILEMIDKEIESLDEILVPYKARAWTVKSTKR